MVFAALYIRARYLSGTARSLGKVAVSWTVRCCRCGRCATSPLRGVMVAVSNRAEPRTDFVPGAAMYGAVRRSGHLLVGRCTTPAGYRRLLLHWGALRVAAGT
jgi:hypothetical protein